MRNHHLFANFLALIAFLNVNAQSTMDHVLSEIARNNKAIQANVQFREAQKLQYKTGITLPDPSAEYDFLKGSPSNAGDQHEFTIYQQFDFPTAYFKKSQLAKQQVAMAETELIAARQEILLDAKKVCLELIYRNKLQHQLESQKQNIEKLLENFQTRLDKGDGNILDVNKAKIQLIEIKKQFQENISSINQLNEKIKSLNGGNAIVFSDTVYPVLPAIPDFTLLESEYENSDPLRKILEQQKLVTQMQLEVSRALWLPKFEAGYHYQGILGQTYNGIHTGISIPLWENNNTIRLQKSKLLFDDLNIQSHRTEHYHDIKQLYEKYTNLKIILEEYQTVFATVNNTTLLNKALLLGEISTVEYFLEMNYYTNALNGYYQSEKEYYEVIADLFKYQL